MSERQDGFENKESAMAALDALNEPDNTIDEFSTDAAAASLMKRWELDEDDDGESLSDDPKDPDAESQDDPADEGEQDPEDGAEDGKSDEDGEDDEGKESDDDDGAGKDNGPQVIEDDVKVTVKVNGEDKEFAVGDLKRLAGQEAALTQKSQAVSSMRETYEKTLGAQKIALETMLTKAQERFAPYKDMDFNLAAQQYDKETYEALRDDARSAYNDLRFFGEGIGQVVSQQQEEAQKTLQEKAVEAVKVLQDPATGIEGFNADLMGKMQKFAGDSGLSKDVQRTIVDPAAWKIIHMAMKYQEAATARDSATEVRPTVKKVVKTKRSVGTTKAKKANKRAAGKATFTNGDPMDAATNVFMEKWGLTD